MIRVENGIRDLVYVVHSTYVFASFRFGSSNGSTIQQEYQFVNLTFAMYLINNPSSPQVAIKQKTAMYAKVFPRMLDSQTITSFIDALSGICPANRCYTYQKSSQFLIPLPPYRSLQPDNPPSLYRTLSYWTPCSYKYRFV